MRVFIAGSRKITKLNKDILERLGNILRNEYEILIGDANGVDRLVQTYANQSKYEHVKVYCVNAECRNNVGNWHISAITHDSKKRDFKYYASKDDAMVKDADYGFLIWDGKSKGTLRSMFNLIALQKHLLLYYHPDKRFFTLASKESLYNFLSTHGLDSITEIDASPSQSKYSETAKQNTFEY
jgi:hypothetical protein